MTETGLTDLALASKLTGYWSFGFAVWSACPQLFLNWHEGSARGYLEGGPSWALLVCWLLGDSLQLAGMMVIGDTLVTQRVQGVWAAANDLVIFLQLLYYRGIIPGTAPARIKHEGRERLAMRDQEEEDDVTGFYETPERRRHKWRDFDGPRLNAVFLIAVLLVGLLIWLPVDFLYRDTATALEPSLPPLVTDNGSGWIMALLWKVATKRTKGLSAYLFRFLILQNLCYMASILTVSHTADSVYAQAPFLADMALSVIFDSFVRPA
ncbi:hypothetical protein JCM10207_003530 [Rhodosporidiobolus poonsookiae]